MTPAYCQAKENTLKTVEEVSIILTLTLFVIGALPVTPFITLTPPWLILGIELGHVS